MFVPLIFFTGSLSYALCVNFVPAYTKVMDALTDTDVGLQTGTSADEETAVTSFGNEEKNVVISEKD